MKKTWPLMFILLLTMSLIISGCNTSGTPVSGSDEQVDQSSSEINQEENMEGNENNPSDEEGEVSSDQNNDPVNTEPSQTVEVAEPEDPRPVFTYPDAVRGIYVTGHSAGGEKFSTLVQLLDSSDLNAMVIDIKDDYGNITFKMDEDSPLYDSSKPIIKDPKAMLQTLSEHEIYPIARIVVFKDTILAQKRPELSFVAGSQVWKNNRGEAFVNPFLKEVWDYNLQVAKAAVELGFQEIQFDYVRFPEGFEKKSLQYSAGDYQELNGQDPVQARIQAVTDFVAYARQELKQYDVDVSVDIFGYTVTLEDTPGIGQNFKKISSNVDVISSMIYPSHWGPYNLGVPKPDLDPYQLVANYVVKEKEQLFQLENPPVSRPWIQDFTARWLGSGNYRVYGKAEVEAQIQALNEAGISEFLVWNAANNYTPGVDYTPPLNQARIDEIKLADEALRQQILQEKEAQEAAEQQATEGGTLNEGDPEAEQNQNQEQEPDQNETPESNSVN